MNRNNNTRL